MNLQLTILNNLIPKIVENQEEDISEIKMDKISRQCDDFDEPIMKYISQHSENNYSSIFQSLHIIKKLGHTRLSYIIIFVL